MQINLMGQSSVDSPGVKHVKGLKDYYSDYFMIGAAVTPRSLITDEKDLILQHFISITAENAMKMGPIHPRANE
ncbi:MAG: endo-1,4-beta-xylanase, partial [Chitinophagaceae bacterium]|nr:endo-1,4-beta-xylanase [Chitinophagaceae bacterium]